MISVLIKCMNISKNVWISCVLLYIVFLSCWVCELIWGSWGLKFSMIFSVFPGFKSCLLGLLAIIESLVMIELCFGNYYCCLRAWIGKNLCYFCPSEQPSPRWKSQRFDPSSIQASRSRPTQGLSDMPSRSGEHSRISVAFSIWILVQAKDYCFRRMMTSLRREGLASTRELSLSETDILAWAKAGYFIAKT